MKYRNLIPYFGGKFPHLMWLTDMFPKGNYHFVDLMCGSANVALNVNYPLVTINDINDDVINLFNVLRNHYDKFLHLIYFTPFSRAELNQIITDNLAGKKFSKVERARRFYVRSLLGFGANGSQNNHYGCGFEWKLARSNFYRVDNWNFKLKKLQEITERLRWMQIENRDALELFTSVNKPGNIVYIDPPYVLSTRKSKKRYRFEVESDFHQKLSAATQNAQCFIAISGYDSPEYDELFSGLHKSMNKVSQANCGKIDSQECLWTNYNPITINGTMQLDFREVKP